ncbi:hypothetical protein KAR91_51970, partial [Candidatus Pacearchaeota archaeon]|nr:hypothetical protein [Candidatus Pacearchaeota archaeon]
QAPFIKKQIAQNQGLLFDDGGIDLDKEQGDNAMYGIIPIGSELTGNREIFLGNKEILPDSLVSQTPSEIEASLRDQIEKYVRLYSFNNRYQGGKINTEIKTRFEKTRAEMNIQELERTYEYVQEIYPLNVIGRGSGRSRVETKAKKWHAEV